MKSASSLPFLSLELLDSRKSTSDSSGENTVLKREEKKRELEDQLSARVDAER